MREDLPFKMILEKDILEMEDQDQECSCLRRS